MTSFLTKIEKLGKTKQWLTEYCKEYEIPEEWLSDPDTQESILEAIAEENQDETPGVNTLTKADQTTLNRTAAETIDLKPLQRDLEATIQQQLKVTIKPLDDLLVTVKNGSQRVGQAYSEAIKKEIQNIPTSVLREVNRELTGGETSLDPFQVSSIFDTAIDHL